MLRLKGFLVYTLAALMVLVSLGTFMGRNYFVTKLVAVTGIKVSPWYTGGEVQTIIDHGQYRTLLHRPVFDALIGQKKEGFIQIDWEPLDALPEVIDEDIDFHGNGSKDFHIKLDIRTNKAEITSYNPQVVSLQGSYKLKERRTVRVILKND